MTLNIAIYSIGASDEEHGPALPKNTDDVYAKHVAKEVAKEINAEYIRHLPYSTDGYFPLAKDWNHNCLSVQESQDLIIKDLKKDIQNNNFSHIILISGHGGNNPLGLDEIQSKISKELNIPFLYIPPLEGLFINHPIYGKIIPGHADSCEHSLGLYLRIINIEKFKVLQEQIKENPLEVLKKYPVLMGLAGYSLPELDLENKYKLLRDKVPQRIDNAREFLKNKNLIADKEVGKDFTKGNIKTAVIDIKQLLSSF